jgi:PAT family beta-lactamase induction signal transducer AmpG
MLMLGFSAGLPNLLLYDTISAWMRQAKLPLDVITLFSLVTITYAIKFLWAPIVDRVKIPVLYQLFGKRRSWMLLAQIGVIFGIWLIAVNMPAVSAAVAGGVEGAVQPDPNINMIGIVAIFAVMTAVFGATQDIAIDAWRIEVAAVERQGVMAAAYQWGYRLASSSRAPRRFSSPRASAGPRRIPPWPIVMAIGVLGVLLGAAREERRAKTISHRRQRRSWMETLEWIARIAYVVFGACFIGAGLSGKAEPLTFMFPWIGMADAAPGFAEWWSAKPWGAVWQVFGVAIGLAIVAFATYPMFKSRPSAYFAGTLKEPLEDFFKRYRSTGALILAMICVYRIADFVLNLMTAFYVDVGFSLDEIAGARKLFGVVMSMIGIGSAGGWWRVLV